MKKLLCALLCIVAMLAFVGCGYTATPETETEAKTVSKTNVAQSSDRFFTAVKDRNEARDCYIMVDKETNVMYLLVKYGYGSGLTIMVDSEGNPLLWEETTDDLS